MARVDDARLKAEQKEFFERSGILAELAAVASLSAEKALNKKGEEGCLHNKWREPLSGCCILKRSASISYAVLESMSLDASRTNSRSMLTYQEVWTVNCAGVVGI